GLAHAPRPGNRPGAAGLLPDHPGQLHAEDGQRRRHVRRGSVPARSGGRDRLPRLDDDAVRPERGCTPDAGAEPVSVGTGRRRRLVGLVVGGAVVLSAMLSSGAAFGAQPQGSATLFLTQQASDYTPIAWTASGLATATGLVADSGTWDRGLIRFQGGKSHV